LAEVGQQLLRRQLAVIVRVLRLEVLDRAILVHHLLLDAVNTHRREKEQAALGRHKGVRHTLSAVEIDLFDLLPNLKAALSVCDRSHMDHRVLASEYLHKIGCTNSIFHLPRH
jgi:hypothetical protein